jgi:serine/threonine protein kinase
VRITPNVYTTLEELDTFVSAIRDVLKNGVPPAARNDARLMSLASGVRLGAYEIIALIGSGGMGEVYRARDPRLERDVAVKVLPAALAGDAERLRRFEQEARAAAALNHPNILAVHDVGGAESGVPYVVSELLDGATLRERLHGGPLPMRKAIDFAVQIAHGLAAAHGKGIVHRDLKPENVFVTEDSRVKILDFRPGQTDRT